MQQVADTGGGTRNRHRADAGTAGAKGGGFDFSRRSTLSLMGNFGEVRLGRDLTAGYVKAINYDMFGQVGMGQFLGWSQSLSDFAGKTPPSDRQRLPISTPSALATW